MQVVWPIPFELIDCNRLLRLKINSCSLAQVTLSNLKKNGTFETNNVLSNLQHGFRSRYSTLIQLHEFTHDISSSLEFRNQVDVIFIAFAKAFDSVPHSMLPNKLGAILQNSSSRSDCQCPVQSHPVRYLSLAQNTFS